MLTKQAIAMHARGDLKGAERGYQRALASNAECHEALHGLGLLMHQCGDDDAATSLLRHAVDLAPHHSRYRFHLGEVLRASGRYSEAIIQYRQAIRMSDAHADYFLGLGDALAEAGSADESIEAYRRAVQLAPRDAEIHNALGNALAHEGDIVGADSHLQQAVSLSPGFAGAHHNLALTLKRQGKIQYALEHARRACDLAPDHAEPLINQGQLLDLSGAPSRAVACYLAAAERASRNPALLATIGDCLRKAGEAEVAVDLYRTAVYLTPAVAAHRIGFCQCLIALRQFADAEAEARQVLAMSPDCAPAVAALAICLQARGQFAEADTYLRRALALDPDHTVAAYLLATNGDAEVSNDEIEQWRARLDRTDLPDEKRLHLHFAIGRVHERHHLYDTAFRHFQQANAIKARLYPFDAHRHAAYVDRIIATHTREYFHQQQDHGVADERPIFIVGMPRSGSTLLEQILSAHPDVAAMGEHPEMRKIMRELSGTLGADERMFERGRNLSPQAAAELARRYQASMPEAASEARRVTDKMLGNFLRLGVIALLFPQARVVHCVRDPLDTCVSCFTQDFDQGLRFTTDLSHLASFYGDYARLMAHWRQVLPLPIMDVDYEAMVSDPTTTSRELLRFCGLPWDERCLAPQNRQREIATASVWQARQPVHTDSIQRWRRYEENLGPLIEGLQRVGAVHVP